MSVLDQLRAMEQQVEQRLRELAPLVAEYGDLRKVAERLGLKAAADEPTDAPAAPAPQRAARATTKATAPRGSASTAARGTASRASTRKPTASRSSRSRASATTKTASASTPARASAKHKLAAGAGSETATRRRRTVAPPGSRQQDVLRLVRERPGITVAEIAKELGVDATGIYGVVRRLQAKGQIRKDGTALAPLAAADTTTPSPAAPSSEPTATQSSATPEPPAPAASEPAATES